MPLGWWELAERRQDHRGVHSTGRQHHHIGAEQPGVPFQFRLHSLHVAAAGAHMESLHLGVVTQGEPLGIPGLEAEQLGVAARVVLVVRPADGNVVGLASLALQSGAKRFQEWFHRFGFGWVVAIALGFGGINPRLAMHPISCSACS